MPLTMLLLLLVSLAFTTFGQLTTSTPTSAPTCVPTTIKLAPTVSDLTGWSRPMASAGLARIYPRQSFIDANLLTISSEESFWNAWLAPERERQKGGKLEKCVREECEPDDECVSAFVFLDARNAATAYWTCMTFSATLNKTNLIASSNEMYKFGIGLNRQCPLALPASTTSPPPTTTPPPSSTTSPISSTAPSSCMSTTVTPPTDIPHPFPLQDFLNPNTLSISYSLEIPYSASAPEDMQADRPPQLEECKVKCAANVQCESVFVFLYYRSLSIGNWGCILLSTPLTTEDLGPPPTEEYILGVGFNLAQCPALTEAPTAITDPPPPPTSSSSPSACTGVTLDDETLNGYTLFTPPPEKDPYYPTSEFFDKAFLTTALFFPESNLASPSAERMALLCAERCEDLFDPVLGEADERRCRFAYAFSQKFGSAEAGLWYRACKFFSQTIEEGDIDSAEERFGKDRIKDVIGLNRCEPIPIEGGGGIGGPA